MQMDLRNGKWRSRAIRDGEATSNIFSFSLRSRHHPRRPRSRSPPYLDLHLFLFLFIFLSLQYVGRELINHSRLLHPHVIQFREVFLTDDVSPFFCCSLDSLPLQGFSPFFFTFRALHPPPPPPTATTPSSSLKLKRRNALLANTSLPQYLAIVMEFASGGDMFQYVKARGGLDEADARWFFQQLVIGLDYCHRMGVVNRDIKLENTLLDGGARPLLKICDFGYSKNEKDSLPKSKVGTPVSFVLLLFAV